LPKVLFSSYFEKAFEFGIKNWSQLDFTKFFLRKYLTAMLLIYDLQTERNSANNSVRLFAYALHSFGEQEWLIVILFHK
jgi:hypothetical protein